ncbi:MAG: 4-alpha-glucanotransferase [Gammaproteobacteria bacterium]|nr:4-alpha-glucanotransferase [Gammaproteobacteria bacterium]
MLDTLLDQLARQCGIGDAYHNYRGELMSGSARTKRAILAAMDCPTDDPDAVARVLHERSVARWRSLLPPVAVVHPGRSSVAIAVGAEDTERSLDWVVTLESGGQLEGRVRVGDLPELERGSVDDRWHTRRALPLPEPLAHGYHTLRVTTERGADAQCTLISAPRRCFEPQVLHDGRRLWGVSVQLYTLRSKRNWGIGDFDDLEAVVRDFAPRGASFIGVNPLHALFPGNPWHFSPYSPSSRHFLNVLYIAVERLPEFAECAVARDRVAEPEFQAELERLRNTSHVDYPGVARAKLPLLRSLFGHFRREHLARNTARAAQFREYVAERGESLRLHALHDAIDECLSSQDRGRYWGWPVWPEDLRDPVGAGVRAFESAHAEIVEYYAWLQWLAEEQLGAVQRVARDLGMKVGLYGDYAVGVNPSGSETWSDQALYRKGAGVGAPPDALALKGQDWGIPPQDPNVLTAEAYQPFRNLIAANMRHFGALRLDHVMALFRQWWVPVGLGATDGGYVHYPLDDLMSVLALESERHACLVVGEDLGTVPPEMSHAMGERHLYSYRVLLFEKHPDGRFRRPEEYPRRAIATVTTHDLPTLGGYWSGNDVDLRQRLARYPSDEVRLQVLEERIRDRDALLAALRSTGLMPSGCDGSPASYSEALALAIHVYLARSAAALVVVQIEDLVGMLDPVNVPGTSEEHANWQRKMSCGLEDVFASDHVAGLREAVAAARGA